MTTYTKRTNAKRAAIAAGIPEDQVEITVHKEKGEVRFGFKQKTAAPAPAPTPAEPVVTTPAPVEASAAPTAEKPAAEKPVKAPREKQNGVSRPAPGGKCAAAWEAFDQMRAAGTEVTAEAARLWAESVGANASNAMQEVYPWRKFNGVTAAKKAPKGKTVAKSARPAIRVDGSPDPYLA